VREQGLADGENTGAGHQTRLPTFKESRKGMKRQGNSKCVRHSAETSASAENWGTIGQ